MLFGARSNTPLHGPVATVLAVAVGLSVACGCAALRDDLGRAETSYREARYEQALVWLEDLEDDTPHMDRPMRARYYYLRGMTAYRLGDRNDAMHYLALAREVAGRGNAGLRQDWNATMERTLRDLVPDGATFRATPASEGRSPQPGASTPEAGTSAGGEPG